MPILISDLRRDNVDILIIVIASAMALLSLTAIIIILNTYLHLYNIQKNKLEFGNEELEHDTTW